MAALLINMSIGRESASWVSANRERIQDQTCQRGRSGQMRLERLSCINSAGCSSPASSFPSSGRGKDVE